MNSAQLDQWSDDLDLIAKFFKSETEKIYLMIARDEAALYDFMDASILRAVEDKNHLVFRYEFWQGEHFGHLFYRWLRETAFGQAFQGNGSWTDYSQAQPQLMRQLRLLVENDIRPLEIRFMEALRFISKKLEPGRQLIVFMVPRTDLKERSLVDFFQLLLRMLPVRVKMAVGQLSEDYPAQQPDFCPSNRVLLDGPGDDEPADQGKRYPALPGFDTFDHNLLRLMQHLVHPASPELLSRLSQRPIDEVIRTLDSPELKDLVEKDGYGDFRLACPRVLALRLATQGASVPLEVADLDRQAAGHFEKLLKENSTDYPAALYHSLGLFRLKDPAHVSTQALSTYETKVKMGAGDICELELDRASKLQEPSPLETQADVLLKLGEVRESRSRYREAITALEPAIEILTETQGNEQLQFAYELKGRAAFNIRDMDAAETALHESLRLAREMDRNDLAADINSQIGYLYYSSKQLNKAEKYYKEALTLYRREPSSDPRESVRGEAAQLANLGHTYYAGGDFDQAESYHRKALGIYESRDEMESAANQWGYLGHTFFAAKSFKRATEAYEKAAALEIEKGKPEKAAQRFANVGHTMYAQRDADLAVDSFQKALEIYEDLGNPEGKAAQFSNLGLVYGDKGEYDQAVDYFTRSCAIFAELGDTINEASQIIRLGHVKRAQKQFEDAREHYQQALDRYRSLTYPLGEANTEMDLGQLHLETRKFNEALECFQQAKSIFSELGDKEKEALSWMMLAQAQKGSGQVEQALDAVGQARKIFEEMDAVLGMANATSQLGFLYFEQKDFDKAEQLYKEALGNFKKGKDREGQANVLTNLGTLYYQSQRLDAALKEYSAALTLLREMNHPTGIAGVLSNMAFIHEHHGNFKEAHSNLMEAGQIYDQLKMKKEAGAADKRIRELEKKAGRSLDDMRAELFPGLGGVKRPREKTRTKIGRNDPCVCGSGKKYKKCCGA